MVVSSFYPESYKIVMALWLDTWLNIINDLPSQHVNFLFQRHNKRLKIKDQNIVLDVLDHTLQFKQEGRVPKVLLADTWHMSCLLLAC